MKKIIVAICVIAVLFSITACRPKNQPSRVTPTADPQGGTVQTGRPTNAPQVTDSQGNPVVTPDDGGFELEEDILTGGDPTPVVTFTPGPDGTIPTAVPNATGVTPTPVAGATATPNSPAAATPTPTSGIIQNPDGTITLPMDRF